jgi:D-psicose/D-tagatose/L-ribulose 3-epimerase
VEGLSAVSETLAEHRVTLAVEPLNRFETYFLNITADAVQLCKEIGSPQIGILLDTFHANIEEKQLGDAFRLAGPWLCHVHTCENDRGTPGSGHVPWPDVFAALEAIHYDGWLTIESFGFSLGKLSAAASIWRDIELTPDQIAAEGLPFLRHQAALPATNSSRTSGKPSLS